jgi:hypothetical protein
MNWTIGVQLPVGAVNFSLCQRVKIGSGGHTASYPLDAGSKVAGRDADHTLPACVEIKNNWSCTSTPPYAFMAWWLAKHKKNLIFTLELILQAVYSELFSLIIKFYYLLQRHRVAVNLVNAKKIA